LHGIVDTKRLVLLNSKSFLFSLSLFTIVVAVGHESDDANAKEVLSYSFIPFPHHSQPGWASAYTIEAVLMQFAASLVKGQGRICRKAKINKEFNRKTAEEAFRSLVKTHEKYGWITPSLSDG